MSEQNNKNILKFSNRAKSVGSKKSGIKEFQGFEYIKMDKDLNGTPFIKESLEEYADSCRYMVRVMREKDKKVCLYNYYIPQDSWCMFLTKIENGEFDGRVIEVEKYIPEDLA